MKEGEFSWSLTVTALAKAVTDSKASGASADNDIVVLIEELLLPLDELRMLERAWVSSNQCRRKGNACEGGGLKGHDHNAIRQRRRQNIRREDDECLKAVRGPRGQLLSRLLRLYI